MFSPSLSSRLSLHCVRQRENVKLAYTYMHVCVYTHVCGSGNVQACHVCVSVCVREKESLED